MHLPRSSSLYVALQESEGACTIGSLTLVICVVYYASKDQ